MKKERNFFACSVGEPGKDYVEGNLERIIRDQAFVLHENTTQKGVYYNIKPRDILLLKYNNRFIAYGETTGIIKTEDESWNLRAPVNEWAFKNPEDHKEGVSISGIGYETIGGGRYGTVKDLTPIFGLAKMKEINDLSALYLKIIHDQENNNGMIDKINLLKYKKQIILQGPPGTGKTRLAKLMAKEMTKVLEMNMSPMQKIDEFFRTFDTTSEEVKKKRSELTSLLNTFQQKFPKSTIKDLTVDTYSIGTGRNDSFCWWIERGLKPLGYYFPGSARSYLIYWSKEQNGYSTHFKHSKLLSGAVDLDDSMSKLAGVLSELISTQKSDEAFKILGDSQMLKILHSYYPEKYFPVNSVPCLNNILRLLKVDSSKLNFIQKNLKVQEIFNEKNITFKTDVTNLEFMVFLFDNFNLKGVLPVLTDPDEITGEYKFIQFHPAYSYEDFVRGITAKTNSTSQIEYKVENKILAEFAQSALDNPSANYVLIIDEINRANLPSVLGELIYALEYRYDPKNENETTVDSMYSIADPEGTLESYEDGKKLKLPINLYIIGTMNTADRSVGHIDYAIRRRFAFVNVLPSADVIDEVIQNDSLKMKAQALFCAVSMLFLEKTEHETSVYLAADFDAKDVQLGHSYFLAESEDELRLKLEFEIKPILQEYLKDGIFLKCAEQKINQLDV
jgi:5-methylcytosine-specific restriction protein B